MKMVGLNPAFGSMMGAPILLVGVPKDVGQVGEMGEFHEVGTLPLVLGRPYLLDMLELMARDGVHSASVY